MAAKALRAVTPDEKAPPKSLAEAASAGDARSMLVSMRGIVAERVQDKNTSPRDLAALTRRLMEINNDIQALDLADEQDGAGGANEVEDGDFDASAV